MTDGIRDRHPEASSEEIRQLLFRQVEMLRRMEQAT